MDRIEELTLLDQRIQSFSTDLLNRLLKFHSRQSSKPQLMLDVHKLLKKYFSIRLKHCSKCKEWMEPGLFHRDKYKKDGRRGTCKGCEKMVKMGRYWADPEKYREIKRRSWRKVHGANGKVKVN